MTREEFNIAYTEACIVFHKTSVQVLEAQKTLRIMQKAEKQARARCEELENITTALLEDSPA
jgi:hypothetical protein